MRFLAVTLSTAALLLSGCSTPVPPSQRSDFCPRHHTALKSKEVYRITPKVMADPTIDYVKKAERYPCHTPWYFSDKKFDIYADHETIRHCPKCDEELSRALR
jgi:hypothetical protein